MSVDVVWKYAPKRIIVLLIVFTFCSFVTVRILRKLKKENIISNRKSIILSLFMGYIFIVLFTVVFCRIYSDNYKINMELFSNYVVAFREKDLYFARQDILNIVLFIPFGYFMFILYDKLSLMKILIVSIGFSFLLEFGQLILKSGWFELNDIFNNTIGGILGYYFGRALSKLSIGGWK